MQIQAIIENNKKLWASSEYRSMVFGGLIFFGISTLINHGASLYANYAAGSYVPDLLLDHLPVVDVDGLLNYGAVIFAIFIIGCMFYRPKSIPFVLKSLAFFIVIRAAFITLTHLGPDPSQAPIDADKLLSRLILGNDFFFSGHTGLPFLLALIYWQDKLARYVSLFFTVLFANLVIFGHLHYSIDVAAAFFIAHSIFHLAKKLFNREYAIFSV
ncbi:hypothetical protein HGA64_00440 [Candidatus Falkowbacteria bacterium]|nr:hypothetical protein [Candidatus Falkowbacteria bacterium]